MATSRPVFSPTPSSHSSFSLVDRTPSSDALSDDGFEVILAARSDRSASITALSDEDDDVLLVRRGTTVMSTSHLSFSSLAASGIEVESLAASVASLNVRDEPSSTPIIDEAPSTPAPVASAVLPITPDPTPKKPKRSRRVRTKHGSAKQQPATAVTPKPAPAALTPVANTPSKKKAKKTVAPVVVAYPSPTATPAPSRPASVATVMAVTPRKSKAKKKKAISENKENVSPPPITVHQNVVSATFLPIVDDLPDDESSGYSSYEAAIQRISEFLANPVANPSQATRLSLLQSLIIELGLCGPSSPLLPGSITAAQKFLKSHAFINIRDYVTVRSQGLEALKAVMFPSQSALRRDLKQRRASLKWVKKHGLSPLLVQTRFI